MRRQLRIELTLEKRNNLPSRRLVNRLKSFVASDSSTDFCPQLLLSLREGGEQGWLKGSLFFIGLSYGVHTSPM